MWFIRSSCRKSCGLCGGSSAPPTACMDTHADCAEYLRRGFCLDPSLGTKVRELCPVSCGLCLAVDSRTPAPSLAVLSEFCADKQPGCASWQSVGHCDGLSKAYMEYTCCASCTVLPPIVPGSIPPPPPPRPLGPECQDKDSSCPAFRDQGHCTGPSYAYFASLCPKTCGASGCATLAPAFGPPGATSAPAAIWAPAPPGTTWAPGKIWASGAPVPAPCEDVASKDTCLRLLVTTNGCLLQPRCARLTPPCVTVAADWMNRALSAFGVWFCAVSPMHASARASCAHPP
jgi:hypothetical protein